MFDAKIIEFALASLAIIALPGPDQALITRNALVGGRAAAKRTMVGGASGLTIHATAAALGVSAVLASSAAAYSALKVVGVAYLIFLGGRMLLGAGGGSEAAPGDRHQSRRRPFIEGFFSNALNPKVALFFLTFLPQFVPSSGSLPAALALSALFAAIYLAWFSTFISFIGLIGNALRRPRVAARMERITGSALIAFAVRLALHAKP